MILVESKSDDCLRRIEDSIGEVLLKLEDMAMDNHVNKLADAFLKVAERPKRSSEVRIYRFDVARGEERSHVTMVKGINLYLPNQMRTGDGFSSRS